MDSLSAAVDSVLATVVAERRQALTRLHPEIAAAADGLTDFLAGGKRLRPQFCWWGWRAAGGRADPMQCAPVVRVAAALELVQACALLHDDVIDKSETRRGHPAMHRVHAKAHADEGWSGDPDHHGVSMAMLLGDLALAWADDLFVTGAHQMRALDRALPAWQTMRTEVLGGQMLDQLTSVQPPGDPQTQLARAYDVIALKTAGYTVVRPLLLGAALANASAETRDRLQRFGSAIGTAFQLRDDLLGVFGDPAVTGKPASDDLREGKRTVLLALVRAELTDAGRLDRLAELDAGVGTATTPEALAQLHAIVATSSAAQQVEARISELVDLAVQATDGLPTDIAQSLSTLATSATARVR